MSRRLYIPGLVFVVLFVAFARTVPVSAYDAAYIDANIPNARTNVVGMEEGCETRLAAARADGGEPRANVNASNAYPSLNWISVPGQRATDTIPGTYGSSAPIPLQSNKLMFICAILTDPIQNADYFVNRSGIVTTANYPNDRTPNSSNPINVASLHKVTTRINSVRVVNGGGSVTNIAGKEFSITRNNTSRYWFSSPILFDYDPGGPLTSRVVTVEINATSINTYTGDVNQCGPPLTDVQPGEYGSCPSYTYWDTITVDAPQPTASQCGAITLRPQRPEVSDPIVVTPIIRYAGGPSTPNLSAYSVSVTNSSGAPGNIPSTATASNGVVRITSSSFRVPAGGQYTVRWSATINGATVTCGGRFAPGDSFIAMSYPFIKVNGGDTVAGVSFSAPNGNAVVPCSAAAHNPDAGVVSSNRNTAPNYTGAGGSYAVYAMNYIQSFASDQGKGRPATTLSFANLDYPDDGANTILPEIGRFGGLFGSAPCVDYWGAKPPDNQLTALGTGQSLNNLTGNYRFTGNLSIGNTLIQSGRKLTLYVKGDVSITGDIVYQNSDGSWAATADIPNFKLIVNGRIFINASVDQLDGSYVAIPNSNYLTAVSSFGAPASGTISTCSNGFVSYNPQLTASNNMTALCNNRLTVNGSFTANQILLLRTFGTLSSNEPAEVFNYTPELWLAPSGVTMDGSYESMTGLPPIL